MSESHRHSVCLSLAIVMNKLLNATLKHNVHYLAYSCNAAGTRALTKKALLRGC